ncbi:unnamed protein product, partial [Brassicogethes aeneus]
MKVIFVVALVFAVAYSADEKNEAEKSEDRPKIFKRLIPADVLRDFPGMCFASNLCAPVEVGKTWELIKFCGRSTCLRERVKPPQGLVELIEDCGPLPWANPKCKLDEEKTNKSAAFPDCCPQFICEEGAKLEFPETTEFPF